MPGAGPATRDPSGPTARFCAATHAWLVSSWAIF